MPGDRLLELWSRRSTAFGRVLKCVISVRDLSPCPDYATSSAHRPRRYASRNRAAPDAGSKVISLLLIEHPWCRTSKLDEAYILCTIFSFINSRDSVRKHAWVWKVDGDSWSDENLRIWTMKTWNMHLVLFVFLSVLFPLVIKLFIKTR